MIDWLAERYVVLWTQWVFFLENPTACSWIEIFQFSGLGLALAWAARTSYFAFKSRRVESRALEGAAGGAAHEDDVKLGAAFASIRSPVAALAGTRAARRIADRWRLGILPGPGPVLCNVGFFRPRILLSREVLELLDLRELAAALAHELAHVVRRDNLKRAVAEVLCFAAPVVVWWADSFRLAVSPRSEFLSVLLIGAAAGILTRMVIVPALAYWQERRCDEWAALAVGDRLAVASALVKIAAAKAPLAGSPLLSAAFAFYHAPVSTRVRRLVNGSGRLLLRVDRVTRLTLRLAAVTFFVLATLAIERAESRGLKGHVEIRSCQVGVVVRS